MSQSLLMMKMLTQIRLINTISASFLIHTSIIFTNLMTAFLVANKKIVIKIKIQDLCFNSNSILENVSYSLLTQIVSKDLSFKKENQKIIFINTDNIPYII